MSDQLLIAAIFLLILLIFVVGYKTRQNRRQIEIAMQLLAQSRQYVAGLEALGAAVCAAATRFINELNAMTGALTRANQQLEEAIKRRRRLDDALTAFSGALASVGSFITVNYALFSAFGLAGSIPSPLKGASSAALGSDAPSLGNVHQ